MMKKTLLIALATFTTAIAATPTLAASNSPFTGFYAGAGATRDAGNLSLTEDGVEVNLNGTGFGGNLFAGYSYTFCNGFYLGAEAFGSISSLEEDFINLNIKLKNSYGISILPGYMIANNLLGYVRMGYVRSKFEMSDSDPGNPPVMSFNQSFNGVQYGIGLQASLTNNLNLRGEYIYTTYQSKTFDDSNGDSFRFKPSTDQVGLALIYRFA